jgi:hypothetical protein
MEVFSPLPDERTRASDTSNTVAVIGELCLKPPVNVVRIRVLVKEKPNEHSLLVLDPAVKISTYRNISISNDRCSLSARARMPSSGARKVHSIVCLAIYEAPLASRWKWPRPLLMDPYVFNLADDSFSELLWHLEICFLQFRLQITE